MATNIMIEDLLPGFKEAARPGQFEGVLRAFAALQSREQSMFSWDIPPRYGKTDMVRIFALLCRLTGITPYIFHLVPQVFLRKQAVSEEDLQKCVSRYKTQPIYADQLTRLVEGFKPDPRVMILTATIHLFIGEEGEPEFNPKTIRHRANMVQLIKRARAQGQIPVIVSDEAHLYAKGKACGDVLIDFREAGAFILSISGTFMRSDDNVIVGSISEQVSQDTKKKYEFTEVDESLNWCDEIDQDIRKWKHRANFQVTLEQAFGERGALAKLDAKFINATGVMIKGEQEVREAELIDMTQDQVRAHLWRTVRHPRVIEEGVRMMIENLRLMHLLNPAFKAIVFCGNDRRDDKVENDHCKNVLTEITRQSLTIAERSAIVTGTDEKAQQKIDAFRKGELQVLIVKQMGGTGLDVPELKVLLDLSTIRTLGAQLQRMFRVGTRCLLPVKQIEQIEGQEVAANVGIVILLGDKFSRDNFAVVRDAQGLIDGYDTKEIIESRYVDGYLVPRTEDEKDIFLVDNAEHYMSMDSSGNSFSEMELRDAVRAVFTQDPALLSELSEAQVANTLKAHWEANNAKPPGGSRAQQENPNLDVSKEKEILKKDIGQHVADIVQVNHPYKRVPVTVYEEAKSQCWNTLKSRCGIKLSVEVQDIQDVNELQRLLAMAKAMLREEHANKRQTGTA